MGNTGGRERSQPPVDDSGPTVLQTRINYGGRANDGDVSFASRSFQSADDDDFEFVRQMQGANLSSSYVEDYSQRKLPSVVKWEGGGQTVYVSFDDGATKIPMVRSQNNFYTIIDLPEGTHHYRFLVDGQWRCDTKEPRDSGGQNNIVIVKASDFEVFEALAVDSIGTESAKTVSMSGSPPGSYSQDIPVKLASRSPPAPPTLPPQLLQVILNTDTPLQCEPTVLPEPNHVMLNHLYALSIKDGVMVMSGTHRYRKKYVTTLLYKPTN